MAGDTIRRVVPGDLDELLRLEATCFDSDRLSRRSFKRWLRHPHCVFLVCTRDGSLCGYVLVIRRQGTRLARLYSIAVDPASRGRGIASSLLTRAEGLASDQGSLYMRLEVASDNENAIALYHRLGYRPFGYYRDYYDDHGDAVRMEKCIHPYHQPAQGRVIPWLAQSTAFTCGPASLMMAMATLDGNYRPSLVEEIQIWREATTIFMTSGHGGCHPIGLALSAVKRGFSAEVWVNQRGPLFVDSVRDPNKKRVMSLVHQAFVAEAEAQGVPVHYREVEQGLLVDRFAAGDSVLILISTYRLDRKKAPHWVMLSGYDDTCLYVNDPDLESARTKVPPAEYRDPLECQHVPVARDEFSAMSRFGAGRLRTSVILSRRI